MPTARPHPPPPPPSPTPHARPLDHPPSRKPTDPGPASPTVRLTGVSAGYGARPAINDVDVVFRPGRLTAVCGPNGGGKSTLLKVVAGLLPPWSGDVDVLGAPPGVEARRGPYVPPAGRGGRDVPLRD